jgi:hypothetical protein
MSLVVGTMWRRAVGFGSKNAEYRENLCEKIIRARNSSLQRVEIFGWV